MYNSPDCPANQNNTYYKLTVQFYLHRITNKRLPDQMKFLKVQQVGVYIIM